MVSAQSSHAHFRKGVTLKGGSFGVGRTKEDRYARQHATELPLDHGAPGAECRSSALSGGRLPYETEELLFLYLLRTQHASLWREAVRRRRAVLGLPTPADELWKSATVPPSAKPPPVACDA